MSSSLRATGVKA